MLPWIAEHAPGLLAGLTALFGAITLFYTKIIRPSLKGYQNYREMLDHVNEIHGELTPNGGSSLYDLIYNIDKEVMLGTQRQRAVMYDDPVAIFETDMEGSCVWVNRTYTKWTQRSYSEVLGHGWVNAIHPEDRPGVIEEWERAVAEDREFEGVYRFITIDEHSIPVKCRTYKMVSRDKKVLGYIGLIKKVRSKTED